MTRDAGRTPDKGMPGDSKLIFERLNVMLNVTVSGTYNFQSCFRESAIFPKSQ